MSEKKQQTAQCIITPEMKKRIDEFNSKAKVVMKKDSETLVIRIDGGLGRVIAMSGAITEKAKHQKVKVITSRPLVFWGNPYIESVHGLDDRRLFQDVIKGNDYIELEPYIHPDFFNEGKNRLDVASEILGLDKVCEPCLFLAEHEKIQNTFGFTNKPKILFQPFGSTVQDMIGSDKSYRSFYVKDAQYIANKLNESGFEVGLVIRQGQPQLAGCVPLDTPDLRRIVSLCDRYPLLGCDSALHHAVKAFGKKAVVVRAGTDQERYGYSTNVNLREFPMVAHTPMRLPMNNFDFDISNQHTNQFTKEFLDKIVETTIQTFRS